MKKAYIFLGDLLETDDILPLPLFKDFVLVRPDEQQLETIKEYLNQYSPLLKKYDRSKYENKYEKINDAVFQHEPLPREEWKYFILQHDRNQSILEDEIVLLLSDLELNPLFEKAVENGHYFGLISNPLKTLNYIIDNDIYNLKMPETKKINSSSIENLIATNDLVMAYQEKRKTFIDKALQDLLNLKYISERTPFKILGYFSILELLITTYKSRGANDSSISGQLQRKINLINNQSKQKINVADYFKGSDALTVDKLISKLYQYRNDIAHGNLSDFETDLLIFKNQQNNILPFLNHLTKQMLINAITNPQLIQDLKEC